MTIISIIFYILLLDALGAVFMAYSGAQSWWMNHLGSWGKHFPLARGWVTYYLVLVLFIGWILQSTGMLVTSL